MSATSSLLIYIIFALGAAGVYLAMPQRRRWPLRSGMIVSAAALAALLVFVGRAFVFTEGTGFYFFLLSAIALFGGVCVIIHPKPVYSAVFFVLVVLASAGLLLLLKAEFLAMALVIVYAGAIMVTYMFVIMLAQQSGTAAYDVTARQPLAAVTIGFLLAATIARMVSEAADFDSPAAAANAGVASAGADAPLLAVAMSEGPADAPASPSSPGNTIAVGAALLTQYGLVFELAGVLLLVAIVGAIALVRRRVAEAEAVGPLSAEPPPPGTIGRKVDPF